MTSSAPPAELSLSSALEDQSSTRRGGVTWRSVFVGTLAVIAVCGLTPLNDYTTYAEASLTAGFLPLSAVLILFLLVVGINAPLHRWAPGKALTSRELAVVLLMTLVACSIPNWGLMRFFVPTPVAPFHLGGTDDAFSRAFTAMGLPRWLFPVDDVASGRSSTVVQWFYSRVPEGEAVPFGAWVLPLLAWGVFIAAMFATLVAMARLVLEQWAVNERLPFPLVQVQTALIEAPQRGRALNELFRSRMLWIALGSVFAIDMLIGLNAYDARWPAIPLRYDLAGIFSEEPLIFLRPETKSAMVSFMIVGVTYFIRSRAAFSLWAIYLICNGVDVAHGMRQGEMPDGAWQDQHLGACAAFVMAILWIGRQHWARVLRSAVRPGGPDKSYRRTFWVAMFGIAVMMAWLLVMGVQFWLALLIVVVILTAHLVVARVVAETGLPFYRSGIAASQIYRFFPAAAFSGRDIYFAGVFSVLGPIASRDSVSVFTQQGLAVNDNINDNDPAAHRGLGRVIAWSLLVGCLVAAPVTIWCQYSFPTPSALETKPARNYFGAEYVQKRDVTNPFNDHARGRLQPRQHSGAMHLAIGFGATALLQFASLRWAAWPLLPVGFVASHGAFIENAWFSILIGWLAQRVVVRLGGASLFQRARPLFIGIIFGEALAAGTWLLVNAILVMNGYEGKSVTFLL